MPGRFSKKSEAALAKMSAEQLRAYVRQCHASISGRGTSIQRVAGALRCVLNNHPGMVSVSASDVAALRRELTDARARLQQARAAAASSSSNPAPAAAADADDVVTTSEVAMACSICYEKFDHAARKPVALGCGHVMCEQCCTRSSAPKCPYCRAPIARILPLFL